MNTLSKVGIGAAVTGLVIWGAPKVFKLKKKSDAGDKLVMDLDDVSIGDVIKNGSIPAGIKYKIRFSIKNPSTEMIGYENLYVKISIKDSKGNYNQLVDTVPSKMGTVIPPQQTTKENLTAEVRFLNVISKLPDLAPYLMNRARGKAATRDAKVEWTYSSEGFDNLTGEKIIKL